MSTVREDDNRNLLRRFIQWLRDTNQSNISPEIVEEFLETLKIS
ncbi:MAG TPA: hypothetical protein VI756_25970 [Blastocatellia bacterium]